LLVIFNSLISFLIIAVVITISYVFRESSFGIIFRDSVSSKELNRAESLLYTLLNIGWLVGPLIAGFFLVKFGILSVFMAATGFFTISLIFFLTMHFKPKQKKIKKINRNIKLNLLDFIKNKDLHLPYLITTGLAIWWTLIFIYTPLFIIEAGLSEFYVALFIGLAMLPLVLFEYKVGLLSEKLGLKLFFILGFTGLFIVGLICFFISNILIILLLIIIGSIFAAFIEPLKDTFFFKSIKQKDEEKYFPIYNTSRYLGGFIGKFTVVLILVFLAKQFTYLIIAFFMLIIVLLCLKLKSKVK